MDRLKNTITPYRTRIGRSPSITRRLGTFPSSLSLKPAKEVRKQPFRTEGPRHLHFGTDPVLEGKGPGEPPAGWAGAFPGGASLPEWPVYWALWKVLRIPGDPRTPPYVGGSRGNVSFKYQENFGGGRIRRGGSVIDYEVTFREQAIAIRLMTERYHAAAKREQQVRDIRGKIAISKFQKVCDLWSQNFLDDPTGEAVCQNVADCLYGAEPPDPFTWGFRRVRSAIQRTDS